MNDDQQRLEEIRAKLRRIAGHKEWSRKQMETSCALMREAWLLSGSPSIDEIVGKDHHVEPS
jgi:hypothetical protein